MSASFASTPALADWSTLSRIRDLPEEAVEAAFVEMYNIVASVLTSGFPAEIPGSTAAGVRVEDVLSHLARPWTVEEALEIADVDTVYSMVARSSDSDREQLRLHVCLVESSCEDPDAPGHWYAPGVYLHVHPAGPLLGTTASSFAKRRTPLR